jgi:hypothetical protein
MNDHRLITEQGLTSHQVRFAADLIEQAGELIVNPAGSHHMPNRSARALPHVTKALIVRLLREHADCQSADRISPSIASAARSASPGLT